VQDWLDSGVQAVIALIAVAALVVSVVAVIPAFVAIDRAAKANNLASGANVISGRANGLAANANQIAATAHELCRRQESRATEQHDVEWTIGWIDDHHLFIANQGLDAAHNVRFRMATPGSIGRHEGPTVVEPWGHFEVASDVAMPQGAMYGATILLRIVWTSSAGTPHRETLALPGKSVFEHRLAVG
jgi:hypothetical protein